MVASVCQSAILVSVSLSRHTFSSCGFIFQLESDADIDTCMKHCDLLQTCGFRKVLNGNTKTEAVCALKWHFGFYHAIAPLQQYVEGEKKYGVLKKYLDMGHSSQCK